MRCVPGSREHGISRSRQASGRSAGDGFENLFCFDQTGRARSAGSAGSRPAARDSWICDEVCDASDSADADACRALDTTALAGARLNKTAAAVATALRAVSFLRKVEPRVDRLQTGGYKICLVRLSVRSY